MYDKVSQNIPNNSASSIIKDFKKNKKNRKTKKIGKKLVRFFLISIAIIIPISILRLYFKIIKPLPEITSQKLENLSLFSQSSIITDRNGEVLYKLFEENRKQIRFDKISPNIVNAIVATEDDSFWTNYGLDFKSTIRAVITTVSMKLFGRGRIEGASTVTQQLVKGLLLTRDRTIIRKLKEIFLIRRLHNAIDNYIDKRHPNLSSKDLKRKRKEMIMELYTNMVFLGNNAYGVQAASKTYFGKDAKNLNILEGSILAGIIQAPGRYNPYKNKIGRLNCESSLCQGTIGGIVVTHGGELVNLTGDLETKIIKKITDKVESSNLNDIGDNKSLNDFINGNLSFTFNHNGEIYSITYLRGRKDSVLIRMYQEGYINGKEFREAFLQGINIKLHNNKTNIKVPHFTFWIRDLLENEEKFKELGIDKDTLLKGGLTIKTSLDYKMQQIAENVISKPEFTKKLHKKEGNNRSMIYIDSKNGDVLVYVGSLDYNDEKIKGKNDMIQAYRQPGSTMKPLIYAYGLQNLNITLDTPIYDLPSRFGKNSPHNDDGRFMGLMPLRKALAGSRNIPAIKMYFADGQEEKLKPYLHKLGLSAVKNDHDYGYPLALGAPEIPMIQMVQAYSHLSTLGAPAKIDPILEIRGPDGKIIYKKEKKILKRVLEKGPAYLIRKILSDDANMPAGRPSTLRVYGFPNGTKSGTSNMKKKGKSYSRDGWLVLYTPSKVLMARAGNTDGSPMKGYGGALNGPVFKEFFKQLKEKGYIVQENHRPTGVTSVSINKLSGKLIKKGTPSKYFAYTMGYNKKLPNQKEEGLESFEYDKLCGGKASEFTPKKDLNKGYIFKPSSFIPDQRDIKQITEWFEEGNVINTGDANYKRKKNVVYNYPEVFVKKPKYVCENRIPKEDLKIRLAIKYPTENQSVSSTFNTEIAVVADNFPITKLVIFIDDKNIKTFEINRKKILKEKFQINLPKEITKGNHKFKVVAIDTLGYSNEIIQNINIAEDKTGPILDQNNISIKKTDQGYNVTLSFLDESSGVSAGNILISSSNIKQFKGNKISFDLSGLQTVGYIVTDLKGNKSQGTINLLQFE